MQPMVVLRCAKRTRQVVPACSVSGTQDSRQGRTLIDPSPSAVSPSTVVRICRVRSEQVPNRKGQTLRESLRESSASYRLLSTNRTKPLLCTRYQKRQRTLRTRSRQRHLPPLGQL